MKLSTNKPEETQVFAREIQKQFPDVKLWLLYGDLAAGKTTFAKGLNPSAKSPTFTLINTHDDLIHCDFYRVKGPDPSLMEQLEEDLNTEKMILIEWPEQIEALIHQPHLKIRFTHESEQNRMIVVEDYSSSSRNEA